MTILGTKIGASAGSGEGSGRPPKSSALIGAKIGKTPKATLVPTPPEVTLRPKMSKVEPSWAIAVPVFSEELDSFVYVSLSGKAFANADADVIRGAAKDALSALTAKPDTLRSLKTANEISISSHSGRYALDTVQWVRDRRHKKMRSFSCFFVKRCYVLY